MSYNIIPLIIIIVCLAGILIIIIKKFPNLTAIDVNTIPSEKEKEKKDEIIKKRFNRVLLEWKNTINPLIRPIGKWLKVFFKKIYEKIIDLEKAIEKKTVLSEEEKKDLAVKIKKMLEEALELVKAGNFSEAEKKYIEIISWDSKSIEAYKALADLYYSQKEYHQAKETLEYVLRLEIAEAKTSKKRKLIESGEISPSAVSTTSDIATYYFYLGEVNLALKDYETAFKNFKKAVDLEENNPKYLDMLIEVSIIKQNKLMALETLKKLKSVNPDNQKLKEFEERIREF